MTDEDIIDAYNQAGSKAGAAKLLGITRSTFRRRFDKINESSGFLENASIENDFPTENTHSYWVKTGKGSFYVKTPQAESSYDDLRKVFIEEAKDYAPSYPAIIHKNIGDHLLVIDPADIHFGKLAVPSETGFTYNLEETRYRLLTGVSSLLQKSSVFGIDKIAFVLGNDALHIDNPFGKTTSGTPQDTSGMWHEMFQMAKHSFIPAIEECTKYADVHLIHVPSNHDYALGYALSDTIGSWFYSHPNVIANECSMNITHRKYMQYGTNLLGFTHGDGAKENDLPSLMQYEARRQWGESTFATWYVHHTHHKNKRIYGKDKSIRSAKDYVGVTVVKSPNYDPSQKTVVETVRSASPPDSWHDRNGYVNQQAVECFLHHVNRGPAGSFPEWF